MQSISYNIRSIFILIFLATNRRDVTVDFIVLELERRGIKFFRLNTEDIHTYRVILPYGDPTRLRLEGEKRTLELSEVTGAYYRRPIPPEFDDQEPSTANYLNAEWAAILKSIWNALDGRWLNSPFDILRAEDKPRQLMIARRCGFDVPETIITNNPEHAISFNKYGGTVAKPIRQALINDDKCGKVIFTTRIRTSIESYANNIELVPVIFQREVLKRSDIRVIVIDDHVFATTIASQYHEETSVDWRKGGRSDLIHSVLILPKKIEQACIAITKALNLRYSAIDLVEDINGKYWFLEANPNGQWAWIEQRTGVPISAAIVTGLSK